MGKTTLTDLAQLRAPMDDILSGLADQLQELARYKAKYGELNDHDSTRQITEVG